jgi:hypothetical protein
MPFKAFKRIYGPDKLKKLPEKELHTREAGRNGAPKKYGLPEHAWLSRLMEK